MLSALLSLPGTNLDNDKRKASFSVSLYLMHASLGCDDEFSQSRPHSRYRQPRQPGRRAGARRRRYAAIDRQRCVVSCRGRRLLQGRRHRSCDDAYENDRMVAEALASGATDLALTGFTPVAFDFAGKGTIKAIAARTREKRYYEGTELVVSNIGFRNGLQKFEDLSGKTVAIDALGSISRYQLEQIARVKKVDINRVTVKPMQTLDAIARAIGTNEVDAAIMPALHARELLASNQAKLVGWYSELDEIQFGALFASSARRSRNSYGLTGVLVAQGSKFKAYRRHQVARGGDNHRPVRVSRSWNKRRGRSRGQRLFHRPAGTTRCRRHRPSDRLAQGARPDRQDRQRARYGRSEFRQVRIFPQRRISLLPASPCPETIM